MKRFIVALTIMIATVFVAYDGYSTIKATFNYTPPVTKVYVYNAEMGLIRFANTDEEIPQYMKRQMDLICEIHGIKYYLVD